MYKNYLATIFLPSKNFSINYRSVGLGYVVFSGLSLPAGASLGAVAIAASLSLDSGGAAVANYCRSFYWNSGVRDTGKSEHHICCVAQARVWAL